MSKYVRVRKTESNMYAVEVKRENGDVYTYCEYTREDIASKNACHLAYELEAVMIF